MGEVKYARVRGIAPLNEFLILLKGSDATHLFFMMAVHDGTNGEVMIMNIANPQPRCFDNCQKCTNATTC